jgi:hypothetical protein
LKATPTADYLNKGSNISWADCLTQTPGVGIADYGDTDYLYAGKAFVTPQFDLAQMFLRFDVSDIPASHEIVSATLRLYLVEAPDTDFTLRVGLCDATWGTLTDADWGATCTEYQEISSATRTTDGQGRAYIEVALTGALLAAVTESATTIDMLLRTTSEASEPTDKAWLKCYAPAYSDEELRPYLYVKTRSGKEQIFEAMMTLLNTIKEVDGYSTTPKTVGRKYTLISSLSQPKFPAYYLIPGDRNLEEGTMGIDRWKWRLSVVAGVYETADDDKFHRLDGMADDVERLVLNNMELTLPDLVLEARVTSVQTGELFIIDDYRGVSLIHIDVSLNKTMFET